MIDLEATIAEMKARGMTADAIVMALSCLKIGAGAPIRTARQERNHRYYEAHKPSESRLKSTEQDVSDGASASQKEASPAPLEEKTEPPKENTPLRGVQKKRGQRLPSDFAMPDEWRDWAIGRGLPAARVPIEFEKLCNWAANAGSKGVKSDWFRAWQNWVLSAIDALPQNRAPPASLAAPSMSQLLTAIRDRPNAIEPEPPEDRSGFRQAIPHLRAVGAG